MTINTTTITNVTTTHPWTPPRRSRGITHRYSPVS